MNVLFFVFYCLLLAERVGKYLLVKRFFQQAAFIDDDPERLSISILQPILSGDPTLWTCLSRNLAIKSDHHLEFLWLIDTNDEMAQSGCRQLMALYPRRNVRLISLPPPSDGLNPKMFKLNAGVREAQGDIIAVLDDDTILPDDGLEVCIPFLNRPGVGLVFGLPYYVNFSNLWSTLVSCFVNGYSLLTYIPYTFLIEPFTINGMFYMVKRDVLDNVGGFAGLEAVLTDDYAVAKHFRSHGYRLVQTPLCHGISTQVESFAHYFSLLKRWFVFPQVSIMRTATRLELAVFYSLVVLPAFFPILMIGDILLFPSVFSTLGALLYFGFSYYMMSDFNRYYLRQSTPKGKVIWILVMQLLLPLHVCWALLRPGQINWRGHLLRVTKDGRFRFVQRKVKL